MDDIKSKIMDFTGKVAKASNGLIKTTKLSVELNSLETQLNNIYLDIGKQVHQIYSFGGSLGKYFDDKYGELIKLEDKIKELQENLNQAKGSKPCPACSTIVPQNSEFCPKCGASMAGGSFHGGYDGERPEDRYGDTHRSVPPSDGARHPDGSYRPDESYRGRNSADDGYYAPNPASGERRSPNPADDGYGRLNGANPPYPTEASFPAPQENVKICPICKAANERTDKFCLSCGRAI